MSKLIKYSGIALGIILLLLFLVPPFIPLDKYKSIISNQAREVIGRELTINGKISLSILPRPKVRIEDIILSSTQGATYPNFLELKAIEAAMAFGPLLRGKTVISYLELENPKITLEKLPNGKGTWEFELKKDESKIVAAPNKAEISEGQALPLNIQRVIINKGSVQYIDNKQKINIDDLALTIETRNIKGPINFDLAFNVFDQKFNVNGIIKEIGNVIPLMVEVRMPGSQALTLEGDLDTTGSSFKGNIKSEGNVKHLETHVKNLPEGLKQNYTLQAKIEANKEKAKIEDINLRIGQLSATGEAYYITRDAAAKLSLALNPGNITLVITPDQTGKDPIANKILLTSGSIKPFLEALKIDIKDLPTFLFQKISLTSELIYKPEEFTLQTIDFHLSDATAQGMIGVKNWTSGSINLTYDLRTNNTAALITLFSGPASFKLGNLHIKGTTTKKDDILKTDTIITLAKSDIFIKGDIKLDQEMETDLKIGVNGKSLDQTLQEFSVGPARNLGAFNLFMTLSGKFKKGLKIVLDKSSITIRQQITNLKGNASLEMAGIKPKVSLDLDISSLNLDKLTNNASGASYQAVNKERWSKEKINLSFLSSFDGNFNIAIQKITGGSLIFDNLKSKILLTDGILDLKNLTGDFYGGKVEGAGRLSGNKAGELNLKLALKDAQLKNIVPPQGKINVTQGTINFNSDLKSSGDSAYQYINNLRGNVSLRGVDGRISGFDLPKMVNALNNAKDLQTVLTTLDNSVLKGTTEFKTLEADLAIEKGIAKITKAELLADKGSVTANGIINLPHYILDINALIQVEVKNMPPFVAHLYGPIDQPQYKLDSKALQQYLVNNVLTNVIDSIKSGKSSPADILKSVMGGKAETQQEASPETQAPGSEEPSQKAPAEELINKGLKKLFK